ncbi:NAD(P)-dependent oxidoreductase [Pseudomonas petrae]|uniref:NAD(P)-dependent oxidoreductase n=1 Tax=Pseudomonas petrae TaxID=2912190 RepID=A0ABS9I2Z0_9PSED|nr:NAD(P)-dependent oxidoreductase [Pseudomonas petrae]MCF7534910.1 NAD(P)-dependent oxidoreductase [Pseudomonas petrae]MCF7538242.1 NAD(P)-dependent oxidoreductase [Pseudomonas petrae]MCF7542160.1 NAD(P)-dependent oxidoreductase [Pseudomonas petrae]MCF7555605.1 NAD(P)-dependent oxidoreductase [Pseudomonas petrae]
MKIGFLGLGNMGQAVAGNLLKGGHELLVWNRSPEAAQPLVEQGATAVTEPAQAFAADVVFSMLADDKALRAVLLDSGLLKQLKGPLIHVNMATVAVTFADELAELHAAQGIDYIAAPVMGRPNVAAAAKLNIMAAGSAEAIDRVQPLLDLIGSKTWRIGDKPSSANAMKLAMNFMLVSAIEAMSEAAVLVTRHGLKSADLVELASGTIFPGPVYAGYGALIGERMYEPAAFKAVLGLKDVDLVLAAASQVSVEMPSAEMIRAHLQDAIDHGQGEMDLAVLAEVAERRNPR